jgi:hypothetical protein
MNAVSVPFWCAFSYLASARIAAAALRMWAIRVHSAGHFWADTKGLIADWNRFFRNVFQ